MAGAISQAAFCLGYAWAAQRWPWPGAMFGGTLAFSA
jgi:hypothetical protein